MTLFIDTIPNPPVTSLGLGTFDGLHLGHKQLSDHCSHLLTFSPHPDLVLNKKTQIKTLTTLDELRVLYPNVIALKFTPEIAALSPKYFLDTIIQTHLNPHKIVVGYDYHFGFKRMGTVDFLRNWCKEMGKKFTCIDVFLQNNVPVKSGYIRQALEAANFEKAIQLLGHPYIIQGPVVKGDGRGTSLGYPTANIAVSNHKLLPTSGVYTGKVTVEDCDYLCMIYIGSKPTFCGNQKGIEVYIHQFDRCIYHQTVTVFMETFVRPEITFSSKEQLIAQIQKDLTVLHRPS